MLDNLENNFREIKEKEKFLQSLIDGIPDGIRVIDNDYNIVIANKKYYQQIGKNKNCVKCYEAPYSAVRYKKYAKIKRTIFALSNNSPIIRTVIYLLTPPL